MPWGAMNVMDNTVTMLDENGKQVHHKILAEKFDGDDLYLLVEAHSDNDNDEEGEALILKCISDNNDAINDKNDSENVDANELDEEEELILEHVDETHKSFEIALKLFEEDFENFEIET